MISRLTKMTGGSLKQKRQLFPDKLWDLVNNQPSSGIQWSKNGKRIEIDRGQLEKFLQTRLIDRNVYQDASSSNSSSLNSAKFRSHNFDSFIRQLHFYGFKKSGNSYYHDKFQREHPELLGTMKRKYSALPHIARGRQTISKLLEQPDMDQLPSTTKQELSGDVETGQTISSGCASSSSLSSSSSCSISSAVSINSTPQKHSPNKSRQTDVIKMYTMDSTGYQDGQFSFSHVRETSVKAVRDDKSVKISIPELMLSNHSNDGWPKTLVLENQNILSAYFIYKLN